MKPIWDLFKIIFKTFNQFTMLLIFCISVSLSYDNLKDINSLIELTQVNYVYIISLSLISILYTINIYKITKSIITGEAK